MASREIRTAEKDSTELWNQTRSGAWAGRGFHVQHLFSVLILVRQWSGMAPTGFLVPEGLDDCVLEFGKEALWFQVKSRNQGPFRAAEVRQFQNEIKAKAASIGQRKNIRTVVVLEQPRIDFAERLVEHLFEPDRPEVVLCNGPEKTIVEILTSKLQTAAVIAEGVFSDLYRLVAEASQANASLPFEQRRRICTSEVERRIFERLEAEDPSAMNEALASRLLEPIDFTTAIAEPSFYQGVKTMPGHVAAGLVVERPAETETVVAALRQRRQVLIAGQSGAGKSALLWLAAHTLAGEVRWFQVTSEVTAADGDAIVRFVRARRPTDSSPLGLTFDDVGATNCDLWNVLVRELRGVPAVFMLGSVRHEDTPLITNQSDTAVIHVSLSETLAQAIWERFNAEGHTHWSHWREPYEQSEGLMLEFVHLLTQGRRLTSVIEEQVQQRQREFRDDELAIIRATSVLCACGGEVETSKLCTNLSLAPDDAARALKRLLDEHLVRESRPGLLGGLHLLRSRALREASHDEVVFLKADTLWRNLTAATRETLPRIVQSLLADAQDEAETVALRKLAETLGRIHDVDTWSGILTGLGLATLDRRVNSLITILDQHNVQRSAWSLASIFGDPGVEIPELSELDRWQNLRTAVLAFRESPTHDLRRTCLESLPEGSDLPVCRSVQSANRLLSSIAPILGSDPVRMELPFDLRNRGDRDIRELTALLSTCYLFGRDRAEALVDSLGGEAKLLETFRSQTPWLAKPVIEPDGQHGRTVRANWFHVAEQHQADPHQTICDICETLLALSPGSDAAAADAVDALGHTITIGDDFKPFSKNMPRQYVPAKTRVAWNVAFRQIMLARSGADSLTTYVNQMAPLVVRSEKVLRSFTENWSRGKGVADSAAMTSEINEILAAANALAYTAPEEPSSTMVTPAETRPTDDALSALLACTLGNLLGRVSGISGKAGAKAAAVFAGDLSEQAEQHLKSPVWRVSSSPPITELTAMAERLSDVSCILHEIAYGDHWALPAITKAARKGSLGKAVRAAAQHCRLQADRRFRERLQGLEQALATRGWKSKCFDRSIESGSVAWPAREVTVLVEIADFESDSQYAADAFAAAEEFLGADWRFRIAPVMNEHVMASLAMLPSSKMLLPDFDFPHTWQSFINIPFLIAERVENFEAALRACVQVSGIMACRAFDQLHPMEEEVLAKVVDVFKDNRRKLVAVSESTGSEVFVWAVHFLDETWNDVVSECDALRIGKLVEAPLCIEAQAAIIGQANERVTQFAAARVLLLQAECRIARVGNIPHSNA